MESEFQKMGSRVLLYSLPVAILGAAFKLMHFHAANQLLIVGLGSVALGALFKYFPEKKPDAYLTGSFVFTGCIAGLFKLMHWPYSEIVIDIAIVVGIIWGAKTLFFPDKEAPEEK